MNAGWTPILRQILESSVWEEEPTVRVLWVTCLLVASEPGRKGEIDMTVRALAARACLSPEETRRALERLCLPDPHSRSTKAEGRRLIPIDPDRGWGWRLVNWDEYRDVREAAFSAARQERFKARQRYQVTDGNGEALPSNQEKEKEKEKEEYCAEVLSHSAPQIVPERGSGFVFKVVGKGGPSWEAPQALIEMLACTFPNVEIPSEMAKAVLWSEVNPTKRKTARGMPSFLSRWMEKAVNKPGASHPTDAGSARSQRKALTPDQVEKNRRAEEIARRELEEDLRVQREEIAARKAREAAERSAA